MPAKVVEVVSVYPGRAYGLTMMSGRRGPSWVPSGFSGGGTYGDPPWAPPSGGVAGGARAIEANVSSRCRFQPEAKGRRVVPAVWLVARLPNRY